MAARPLFLRARFQRRRRSQVCKLGPAICKLANDIFPQWSLTPKNVADILELRKLDPYSFQKVLKCAKAKIRRENRVDIEVTLKSQILKARKMKEAEFHFAKDERQELVLVLDAVANHPPKIVEAAYLWHFSKQVFERGEERIIVDTDYVSEDILFLLQREVLEFARKRGVVFETLPTSNIRISQYREMKEHHALRWLKVNPHPYKGDGRVVITLGDDDPGVFSTSIKGEFYHLFTAMKRCGLNAGDALKRLAEVNENAEKYMGSTR